MKKLLAWFEGKKTYLVAGLALIWAILGWAMGWIPQEQAIALITTALIGAGLRNGIDKL